MNENQASIDINLNNESNQIKIDFQTIFNLKKPIFTIIHNAPRTFPQTIFPKNERKKPEMKSSNNPYKRKDKSLEELSHRFLSVLASEKEGFVYLDEMTVRLGVERRRIYDIINILESLKLLSRKKKNIYKWNGFRMIYQTIHEYQKLSFQNSEELFSISTNPLSRREKSLEILSIGFLKLFLSWKKIISLEEAAAKLTPPSSDQNKIKTRIRRLYDIANVFKSIGIIRKTHIDSKNKPGFEYLGFQGLETFLKDFYPKNELLQEQGVSIKKQTTIITQNSANLSNNSVLEEEDENRPPKFETNAKNNNFIMSYSNFKKIKRTNQSPFKPLSSSIENNKKISPKIGKHLIL